MKFLSADCARAIAYRSMHGPNVLYAISIGSTRAIPTGPASFRTACPDRQAFFTIQAITSAYGLHVNPRAEAECAGDGIQTAAARTIVPSAVSAIPLPDRTWIDTCGWPPRSPLRRMHASVYQPVHGTTCSALRHFEYILIVPCNLSATGGLHHFFLYASCNIVLSSVRL